MVMAMYMLERVVQVAPQPLVVVSVKREERKERERRKEDVSFCFCLFFCRREEKVLLSSVGNSKQNTTNVGFT